MLVVGPVAQRSLPRYSGLGSRDASASRLASLRRTARMQSDSLLSWCSSLVVLRHHTAVQTRSNHPMPEAQTPLTHNHDRGSTTQHCVYTSKRTTCNRGRMGAPSDYYCGDRCASARPSILYGGIHPFQACFPPLPSCRYPWRYLSMKLTRRLRS